MDLLVRGMPTEFAAIIERRKALGLDGHDEVWDGVYHMTPHAHSRHGKVEHRLARALDSSVQRCGLDLTGAFNLGTGPNNFRVPDLGVREQGPDAVYVPTAKIVIEVLSPDDESYQKMPFYAEQGVEELWIVNPDSHSIEIYALKAGAGADADTPVDRSTVLGVTVHDIVAAIDWP